MMRSEVKGKLKLPRKKSERRIVTKKKMITERLKEERGKMKMN